MKKSKELATKLEKAEIILRKDIGSKLIGAPHGNKEEHILKNLTVIEHILRRPHDAVLDVGCGYSFLIRTLSSISDDGMFVGGDIVMDRMVSSESTRNGVDFTLIDLARPLPFKDRSFDVIVAMELIEHLPRHELFFSETSRILKDGGILIITTPHVDALSFLIMRSLPKSSALSIMNLLGMSLRFFPSLNKNGVDFDDPDTHKVDGFSKDDFVEFGRKNRLEIEYYKTFRIPFPNVFINRLPRYLSDFLMRSANSFFPLGLECFTIYTKKKQLPQNVQTK